jgi:hypothetical protein
MEQNAGEWATVCMRHSIVAVIRFNADGGRSLLEVKDYLEKYPEPRLKDQSMSALVDKLPKPCRQ